MMETLLVLLVFLPVLSGVLFLFFRSRIAKYSAFVISLVECFLTIWVFFVFRAAPDQSFYVSIPWIREWGINIELSLDGINILLVLLSGIAVPLIVLAGWEKTYHNYGLMDGMVLILQGSLMGVFLSVNAFLFYIFWELTLIPAYIILLIWGGEHRMRITLKFFVYTLAGSLFMLVAFISLYLSTPGAHSFSLSALTTVQLDAGRQASLFVAFMLALLIKTPLFPFHSWQPDTYTEAPSAGTMLLGGLMSKMGIFAMLRWLFPILPDAVARFAPAVVALAVFSMIYASVIALQQKNMKTLFAWSSIAHLSMIVASIFTLSALAIQGALLMAFSHGIIIIALFFVADIFKIRIDSQWISDMGGIRFKAPVFAGFYLIVLLASVGFPLTSGFPGEVLMITGLAGMSLWPAIVAGLGLVIGVVYMLVSYRKAMLGEVANCEFDEVNAREKLLFVLFTLLVLAIGIFPTVFLGTTENAVIELVNLFHS
jgi:NADH-quinone oxidoreductase subunit M